MANRLDTLANIAIVVASVAVCGALASQYYQRSQRAALTQNLEPYKAGEALAAIPDLDYRAADSSLLLVVRSTCHFCTESMPFYKRLRAERDERRANLRLVAMCLEDKAICDTYLKSHQVEVDQVLSVPPRALRPMGTPTLLHVDRGGRVLKSWLGRLTPTQEDEMRREVLPVPTASR